MKSEDRTRLALKLLGWQGGTVHQIAAEFGVSSTEFLYSNANENAPTFANGWFAWRTSREIWPELREKNKGDLQWLFGALSGANLEELEATAA